MNICVCVKAVPDSDTVAFDTEKGTLKRTGKGMIANPCDVVAVEAGARLIQANGGSLSVVSMGPSEAGLRTAMAMGAVKAYLLKSNRFAGADVPATAYTLSSFFKKYQGFGVIFCGRHSADGDTGQTGAMLAEQLGIPHACGVTKIIKVENGTLEAVQRLDDQEIVVTMKMPCLVVIRNDFCIPGPPTLQGVLRARRQEIIVEDEGTLESLDIGRCGLQGSATRVVRMFVPPNERKTQQIMLDETGRLRTILEEMLQNDERRERNYDLLSV